MTDNSNEPDCLERVKKGGSSDTRRFLLHQLDDKRIDPKEHLDGEKIKFHKSLTSHQDWLQALNFSKPQLLKLVPEIETETQKKWKEALLKELHENGRGTQKFFGRLPPDHPLRQMFESLSENPDSKGDEQSPANSSKNYYKVIERSFDSDLTHAGLIYYLHFCWAKEHGCQLRPDMLWFTIVSNIAQLVLDSPEAFRHLFTDFQGKKDIVIGDDLGTTRINVDTLTQALRKVINNGEFMDTICETRFRSEPPLAKLALQMSFAYMATPFYNYSTLCGIPFLELKGDRQDWVKLYRALIKLQDFEPEKIGEVLFAYNAYLKKCQRVVGNILLYGFGNQHLEELSGDPLEPLEPFEPYGYATPGEFFSEIFYYGKFQCGSGHDKHQVKGWIRDLYLDVGEDLWRFPTHVNYLPWDHLPTRRMFVQMVGLAYSKISEDNLAIPNYGLITFEVLDEKIFKIFAQRES